MHHLLTCIKSETNLMVEVEEDESNSNLGLLGVLWLGFVLNLELLHEMR